MALTWAVIDPKFDDFITKDNFKAIKVDYRLFAESMANVPKFEYNFKYDFKESYYHTIKDVCARVNAMVLQLSAVLELVEKYHGNVRLENLVLPPLWIFGDMTRRIKGSDSLISTRYSNVYFSRSLTP